MALSPVQRILYPVRAAQNLAQQGFLPKLLPTQSYKIDLIGQGAPTVAAAEQAIKQTAQTVGLPVIQVQPFKRTSALRDILGGFSELASFYFGGWGKAATTAAQVAQTQFAPTPDTITQLGTFAPRGGTNMGFFDFGTSTDPNSGGGIFDTGGFTQNIPWNSLLNLGTNLATNFLQPSSNSIPSTPSAQPVMAAVPMIARGGAVVGRSFFNRFPNLATSIQKMRNAGQNVSRGKLYSMMKRFGPEFLVTGGILTAGAVSELALAGPGRRRMNPANSKALRRAARRIESFHRLCTTTDRLRSRGKHRRK